MEIDATSITIHIVTTVGLDSLMANVRTIFAVVVVVASGKTMVIRNGIILVKGVVSGTTLIKEIGRIRRGMLVYFLRTRCQ